MSYLDEEDLVDNPTTRVPVCLCLDTSGSMNGTPIDELNKGVQSFFDAITNDEVANMAADICIITFGGNEAKCIRDYANVSVISDFPCLSANGMTPMAAAVKLALSKLEERKQAYKDNGIEYYQPWLVLMTDGWPTDSTFEIEDAKKRVCELANNKKLSVFPIYIGDNADPAKLQEFSPKRSVIRLKGLNFTGFFEWLSASVSTVSQSSGDESVALDTKGIASWAEV